MNIDDWIGRWREGRIGFHEGRPNAYLERYVARLGQGRRILVPLCGKTEDLAFLAAQGHEVVGVEIAEDAVRAFFAEHGQKPEGPTGSAGGAVTRYRAERTTLLVADFFACTKEDVGPVDAFYDRAALVALPAEVRPRYVAHLRSLLAPGSPGLLVSFDYPPEQMQGPPFPVPDAEVRALFAGARVERIDEAPVENFRDRSVAIIERTYAITA